MNCTDVVANARDVWLGYAKPKFSADQYAEAMESVFEELFAKGNRGAAALKDERVTHLMAAREAVATTGGRP